jgi:hypothetical protein
MVAVTVGEDHRMPPPGWIAPIGRAERRIGARWVVAFLKLAAANARSSQTPASGRDAEGAAAGQLTG